MSEPAIERVKQLYCAAGKSAQFMEDLFDHLETGYVVATPGNFMMAKVTKLANGALAWHVHHAAGHLATLVRLFPVRMPFIAFYRHGKTKLKIYPMQQFIRRAN